MRSIFILSFSLLFVSLFAQAPQGIKYQAVARDNAGNLYMNEQISVRLSILDSSDTGPILYSERHVLNTNNFGLFSASLGQGVVLQGTFTSVNWGVSPKYLQVEFDPTGSTNYFDMGATQLLSVPYALYSQNAGSAGNSSDSQTLSINGATLSISNGNSVAIPVGSNYVPGTGIDITASVITNTAPDQTVTITDGGITTVSGAYPSFSVNTPAQTLSLNGSVLSISDGNSVTLPTGGGSYVAGTGIDITGTTISNTAPDQTVVIAGGGITQVSGVYPNFQITSSEVPQTLSINANTLSLSNGGGSVNLPVDADEDPANELQTLILNGSQLSISNGNQVSLPSGGVPDADSDSTNELNTNAVLNGNTLEITDAGGTLLVNLSSLLSNVDADSTNELQTLTLNGSTLTLSDGNSVVLPSGGTPDADGDSTNELQMLTLNGNTLTLSDGNSVILPSGGTPDADSDSTNELNTAAVLNGANLHITDAGGTLSVDLTSLLNDADSNPINELNATFVLNGTTLSITDAAGTLNADLSSLAGGADADSDSTNELQDLSSLSNAGNVTVNITGGTGTTFSVNDADSDSTNELQAISLSGDTLELSNGGGSVVLPAGGSGGTLDDAYDFGGAGAGRMITADAGPVEITTNATAAAGIRVTHSGTGVAIHAQSTNAANGFSTIQSETNSLDTTAAVFGSTTGFAYAVAGQVEQGATAFSGVYGSNLRTGGGVGVEGIGFNGISAEALSNAGFGVFANNLAAATGSRPGNQMAVGVAGIGFVGSMGQTVRNNGVGVFGSNLAPDTSGTLYDNAGVEGQGFTGVLGITNTNLGWGVLSDGDIGSTGNVYAVDLIATGGFKTFRIDYPLDPANKFLYHFAMESDEVLNLYRGTVQLDANGEASIELPVYFETVNKNFAYQLTPIGAAAPGLFVKTEIKDRQFSIAGGQPGQKISWQVTAERNDPYVATHPEAKQPVQDKPRHQVGKYVHPAEYGKTQDDAIIRVRSKPMTSLIQMKEKGATGQLKLK